MGVGEGCALPPMSLGVGGLEIGLLGDPGPGVVAPGAHGSLAAVAAVPLDCGVLPATVLVVLEVPVEGAVDAPGDPTVVPLFEGVQGATVVLTPVRPCVPGFCVPRVPPVTLPALPATPGVPGVAAGDPVELAPGAVVVGVLVPVEF
jgi:hypothetical protein